jgi:hypothetical protein
VDANNNLFMVNTASNTATFTFNNGTTLLLSSSSAQIIAATEILVKVNGDADISATGNVNIKGATVNLNPTSTAADNLTTSARGPVTMPNPAVTNLESY